MRHLKTGTHIFILLASTPLWAQTSAFYLRPVFGFLFLLPIILIEAYYYDKNGVSQAQQKSIWLNTLSYLVGSLLFVFLAWFYPNALQLYPFADTPLTLDLGEQTQQSLLAMTLMLVLNFIFSLSFEICMSHLFQKKFFSGITPLLLLRIHLATYTVLALITLLFSLPYLFQIKDF